MDTAGRLSNELDEFCHMLDDTLTAIECYREERPEQWRESARAKVMMEWQKRIEELVEQTLREAQTWSAARVHWAPGGGPQRPERTARGAGLMTLISREQAKARIAAFTDFDILGVMKEDTKHALDTLAKRLGDAADHRMCEALDFRLDEMKAAHPELRRSYHGLKTCWIKRSTREMETEANNEQRRNAHKRMKDEREEQVAHFATNSRLPDPERFKLANWNAESVTVPWEAFCEMASGFTGNIRVRTLGDRGHLEVFRGGEWCALTGSGARFWPTHQDDKDHTEVEWDDIHNLTDDLAGVYLDASHNPSELID